MDRKCTGTITAGNGLGGAEKIGCELNGKIERCNCPNVEQKVKSNTKIVDDVVRLYTLTVGRRAWGG